MVLFRGDIKTKSLKRRSAISVILPADNIHYLQDSEEIVEKPYKTLYLLHGLFGSDDIFLANTTIQKFAEDNNIAVVLPCGENSFYIDNPKSHEYYGKYVGEELVEITRNIFPLSHKREDTFIAGFSMGGYGAIRTGLKYNDTFGAIGAISAALITDEIPNWKPGNDYLLNSREFAESCFGNLDEIANSDKNPKYLVEKLLKEDKNFPKLFIAIGQDDFLYENNLDFANFLDSNNVDFTFKVDEGEHTWDFCDKYIKEFIKWL